MNERERLTGELAAASFAAIEAGLYLDTHPNDRAALE